MDITPILNSIFAFFGVTDPAPILAAVPVVIALVAWLKARGYVVPDFMLWKWLVSGVTATTFLVALASGGYAQYAAGGVWYSVLVAGVFCYLAAAGIYDGIKAVLA